MWNARTGGLRWASGGCAPRLCPLGPAGVQTRGKAFFPPSKRFEISTTIET